MEIRSRRGGDGIVGRITELGEVAEWIGSKPAVLLQREPGTRLAFRRMCVWLNYLDDTRPQSDSWSMIKQRQDGLWCGVASVLLILKLPGTERGSVLRSGYSGVHTGKNMLEALMMRLGSVSVTWIYVKMQC